MYPLDFDACTMRDVIYRSCAAHPTLFIEAIRAAARVHHEATDTLPDAASRDISRRLAMTLRRAADDLDANPNWADCACEAVMSRCETVPLFSIAARLQCLPFSLRSAIAERS